MHDLYPKIIVINFCLYKFQCKIRIWLQRTENCGADFWSKFVSFAYSQEWNVYDVCFAERQTPLSKMQTPKKSNWLTFACLLRKVGSCIHASESCRTFVVVVCLFGFLGWKMLKFANCKCLSATAHRRSGIVNESEREREEWYHLPVFYCVYLFTTIIKWLKMYNQNVELKISFFGLLQLNWRCHRQRMPHFCVFVHGTLFIGQKCE